MGKGRNGNGTGVTLQQVLDVIIAGGADGVAMPDITALFSGTARHANAGRSVTQLTEAGLIARTEAGQWIATAKASEGVTLADMRPSVRITLPEAPPEAAPPRSEGFGPMKLSRVRGVAAAVDQLEWVMSPEEIRRLRAFQAIHGVDDWELWLPGMFPRLFTEEFAPHHRDFWEWADSIELGQRADPFVAVWNRGGAKLLALDTPVPTPSGWSTVGEIRPGDKVFDETGRPCEVTDLSPIETKKSYRLTFRGGNTIVASDDHLWTVIDRATRRVMMRREGRIVDNWASWSHEDRPQTACEVVDCPKACRRRGPNGERWCAAHHARWQRHGSPTAGQKQRASTAGPAGPGRTRYAAEVLTTEQILARGLLDGNENQWCIPTVRGGFDLPEVDLPIDPYVLGYWLGDGTSASAAVTVHRDDAPEFIAQMESRGESPVVHEPPGRSAFTVGLVGGLRGKLRAAGLLGNKHIPMGYLRAGEKQRRELLAGLLDSDGTPDRNAVSFTSTRECLSRGVFDLAVSLGYRAAISEARATLYGRDCGPMWRVRVVAPPADVFYLERKAGVPVARKPLVDLHYLESIEPVGDVPVRCLAVDSPNHLFLAGRAGIPTHNSANAEAAVVRMAARKRRNYCIYVSGTQNLADEHVSNIGGLLMSPELVGAYPDLGRREVGMYGESKGWRRNRLRTAAGFTVDALGLDVAARGARIDEQRPDLIVLDDVDSDNDTPHVTEKKIRAITRKILPAGSQDLVVMFVQNMIHSNSIAARLARMPRAPKADYLARRVVSGPIPAVWDLQWRLDDEGMYVITGGRPSWDGMPLAACQHMLDLFGLTGFLVECQHVEADLAGGMFDHLDFGPDSPLTVTLAEVPRILHLSVWVDPAVTSKDTSDSCAIVVDGLGVDRKYYRLWSWERVSSPLTAMKTALRTALEHGAQYRPQTNVVGVETDQGGDTWEEVYKTAVRELHDEDPELFESSRMPRYESAKAGTTQLSKAERASRMLVDYETQKIRHVQGRVTVLESGLARFPKYKPFDVVDACMVAGTSVTVEGGDRPIESVLPGDRVMTRSGWRRVVMAGPTAWDVPVIEVTTEDGRSFECTPDHRVWTEERGWVPASDVTGLTLTATIGSWEASRLSRSSTAAGSTGGTPTRSVDISRFTTTPPAPGRATPRHFTGRSTSTTTGRSQTAGTSIIGISTRSTTTPTTSKRSKRGNTGGSTVARGPTSRSCWSTWLPSGRWPRRGTDRRRALRGTPSTGALRGLAVSLWSWSASSAATGSSRWSRRLATARSGAATRRSSPIRGTRTAGSAPSAPPSSSPSDARPPASARSRVATVRPVGRAPVVYDLEVEGEHEFFANGLLVHNSYWSWRWLAELGGENVHGKRVKARAPRGSVAQVGPQNLG